MESSGPSIKLSLTLNLKLCVVFACEFDLQLSFRFVVWWKNQSIVCLTLFLVERRGGSRCVCLGFGKLQLFSILMKITRWRRFWLIKRFFFLNVDVVIVEWHIESFIFSVYARVPIFLLLLGNNCYMFFIRSWWKGRFARCHTSLMP